MQWEIIILIFGNGFLYIYSYQVLEHAIKHTVSRYQAWAKWVNWQSCGRSSIQCKILEWYQVNDQVISSSLPVGMQLIIASVKH